jgi:hypothetical protein
MNFQSKDDIFTITLPCSDLVFTRYLYVKDEVRISLLVSLLNKSDDAIFWAYELYYSGFKNELFNLLWKIYYDFFATQNPTFEAYFLKKHKEWLNSNSENTTQNVKDKIVSSIIQDLLFRPFNSDVFFLRNICEQFEIEIVYCNNIKKITNIKETYDNFKNWIDANDYRSIAQWFLNLNKDTIKLGDIYEICLDIFEINDKLTKTKLSKEFNSVLKLNVNNNIILLAKIMSLFSRKEQIKTGKSIYISVESEDIIPYETIIGSNELYHYNVLDRSCICGIDDLKHLSLFKLKRNKYNLNEAYLYKWEYHASFAPIWSHRIKQFGGYPDHMKQQVIFKEEPNDDLMQEFYELYGFEPDEQTLETQNKNIMKIEKIYNWKWFNEQYKKNGLFYVYEEELEEFDVDGLIY